MLVAPLNWGFGHATRCIPFIQALINDGFEPVIASDGNALLLLQKEFPKLKSYELPSYNIQYTKNGKFLFFKLLLSFPNVFFAIKKEQKIIAEIVEKEKLCGIISDNRFGVFHNKIPSVYITHQLKVLGGFVTYFTSKVHQKIQSKFSEVWIPDFEKIPYYSGELGHLKKPLKNLKYIGILSRVKFENLPKKYDILVVLSGPEPQRTLLEEKLLIELNNVTKKVLFVRGVLTSKEIKSKNSTIEIVNYLTSKELEKALNESEKIIARSGYSTIMDLAVLGKKAYFIPTPGQFEQQYLAQFLKEEKIAPFCSQNNFRIENLEELRSFNGFIKEMRTIDLNCFRLFKSE